MPVRMTQSEFDEFVGRRASTIGGESPSLLRTPRPKKRKAELPENQVESQIVDFLGQRRWIVRKIHVGVFVPWYSLEALWKRGIAITKGLLPGGTVTRVGEKGDPDYQAYRARQGGGVDLLFLEIKATGRKPSPDQAQRIKEIRLTGAVAEWFDDFDFGGPHSFLEWYKQQFVEG